MPIPLRTLRFIHSTYTWTCIGRGSIPRVAPSTAYAHRSPSTLLALTLSSRSHDAIRPRPSQSKRPSIYLFFFFPKYGIWSQTSPLPRHGQCSRRSNTTGSQYIHFFFSFYPTELFYITIIQEKGKYLAVRVAFTCCGCFFYLEALFHVNPYKDNTIPS